MKNLFKPLKVQNYEELTLAANMLRSEWLAHQLKWNVNDSAQNKDLTFQYVGGTSIYYSINLLDVL